MPLLHGPAQHDRSHALIQLPPAVLIVLLTASACSSSAPAPPTAAPTSAAPQELRIYMPQDKTLTAMFNAMVQAAPGGAQVKITFLDETYYPEQQIPWLINQDKPPDLIFSPSYYMAQLVDAGLLLDLREMMVPDGQFNPTDIDERALAFGKSAGRSGQYALPFLTSNTQLFYNKALLQKARVALPTSEWTWDDLIEQCKRLKEAQPSITCLGLNHAFGIDYWYPWVRGYGGDVISADGKSSTLSSAETLDGLQHYAELWTKHKVVSPVQFPSYVDCFISQRCAMILAQFATTRDLTVQVGDTFVWDTQFIPQFPKGRFTVGAAVGFGVAKASKHPAAAWALLKSLVSPAAQGVLLPGNYGLPVLKTIPSTSGTPPHYQQTFLDGRAFSVALPDYASIHACGNLTDGKTWRAVNDAFSEVFYKKGDFAQALPQADHTIQQCLSTAKPAGQ